MKKKEETTMGTLIKEACLKKKITIDELYEKLIDIQNKRKAKKSVRKKDIKNWVKDRDFPDLDTIYDLSSILEIHPNDLLDIKNKMQDKMLKKTNPAIRKLGWKALDASRNYYKSNIFFNCYYTFCICSYVVKIWSREIRNRRI